MSLRIHKQPATRTVTGEINQVLSITLYDRFATDWNLNFYFKLDWEKNFHLDQKTVYKKRNLPPLFQWCNMVSPPLAKQSLMT